MLCSGEGRARTREDGDDGLAAPQERLEAAAGAIKATRTALRNKTKFNVPDEIREIAAAAATCREPVRRKLLRERARKDRREFDAGMAALPRGTVIHRPAVTKLWVNGRASEDRDEWTEEVRARCVKCYDDKMETSELQAERIRYQKQSWRLLGALQGRRIRITIDRVLRARGKMMKNKANGPADCLVTEMLQCLLVETVYEVTH